MGYQFEAPERDYADLASGTVLRSAPGFPAFPVRLASEMFRRGLAAGGRDPVTVWDPCCGSGYLITVVAILHRPRIREVIATDIDAMARAVAASITPEAVLVIAVRGRKVMLGDRVRPVARFKIGTRSVAIVKAGELR